MKRYKKILRKELPKSIMEYMYGNKLKDFLIPRGFIYFNDLKLCKGIIIFGNYYKEL